MPMVSPQVAPSTLCTRVAVAPGRGRGVFATVPIAEGQVIERAPVIVIPGAQWELVSRTVLFDYCFSWGQRLEDCGLVLGHGSFYNHSYEPSARFVRRPAEQEMEYVARRAIAPGEEVTINYHEDQASLEPLWFDVR
jgi:SET domain-containing protein